MSPSLPDIRENNFQNVSASKFGLVVKEKQQTSQEVLSIHAALPLLFHSDPNQHTHLRESHSSRQPCSLFILQPSSVPHGNPDAYYAALVTAD